MWPPLISLIIYHLMAAQTHFKYSKIQNKEKKEGEKLTNKNNEFKYLKGKVGEKGIAYGA